jgi:hypothetical protein
MGEHKLRDGLRQLNLYHALNRTLEGRLAYVGRMASQLQARGPACVCMHACACRHVP